MSIGNVFTLISLCIVTTALKAQDPYHYSTIKQNAFHHAAVVTAHPLASETGVSILKLGGNAVDAAIAVQLALAVVYPAAGNLGGGGFLVAHLSGGRKIALDYREVAPMSATKNMYLDAQGQPVKDLSLKAQLASGVPGTVAGLFASLPYAKLPMAALIAPAILLAEKGFAITEAQAKSFNDNKKKFMEANAGSVAFVKARTWECGDTLLQPELAATLRRIRDFGQKGFYEGETAGLIVKEMKRSNGIISLQDLQAYQVKSRIPYSFMYKGYEIVSMPLPSSGGLLIHQMLQMVGPYINQYRFGSVNGIQLMIEAARRAFADRAEFMGDNDFVKVPVKTLASPQYLSQRMADYQKGKAGSSDITRAGIIHESEETTHISIIDEEGNAVAVTTTLNDSYGSKTIVQGAGFLLNNEMDDFSIKDGVANMYGVSGKAANAITPGKRMLSSMTPTLVLKNKLPFMVVGTPGGSTIPTSVFQTIVNVIDFKLSPGDAVNKPKFHHQWLPDSVFVEKTFPAETVSQLTRMGYRIKYRDPIGRTELILIKRKNKKNKIMAVADSRGDDGAAGY